MDWKQAVMDQTLEKSSKILVKNLSNLGNEENLFKISLETSSDEVMRGLLDGKIPILNSHQVLVHSLYTSKEALLPLQRIAKRHLNGDEWAIRDFISLFYFGVSNEGENRYFGTYFYLTGFEDYFLSKTVKPYSQQNLEEMDIDRKGPSHFLIYDL